ncbi:MAG: response regulator [Proteobacteria bacterium]|nr:response regulator [Pseudomonadota bacterium]
MTIEKAFGIVIRRLRKELLLSQEELSAISSLDRVFISRLERGIQQPKLVTIFQLATALKVSVSRVFLETELLLCFNKSSICKPGLHSDDFSIFWNHFGEKLMSKAPNLQGSETILLVEDEIHTRAFLFDTLTDHGYTVIVAEDGQDAVDTYKENMDRVDLVLMDVMMPRKDGVTAYKEISEVNASSKILLMSGYSSVSLGGIDNLNFIQKPMLPTALFTHIRELLDLNSEIISAPAA